MDAERIAIARECLEAAHTGSLNFPAIIGRLVNAGFEGYLVDYRCGTQSYYLPDGDSITLPLPHAASTICPTFDAPAVERLIRWAQADGPDYSYPAFCDRVMAAGCAGYLVTFLGRRVVYYGRTGDMHVEHFPG
ncbi:hypothetical protein IP70_15350 [alpha proteobacterium AAP38]|nr:hypothetical protein IP70_15350 [alpha proteobacterium AAP38]